MESDIREQFTWADARLDDLSSKVDRLGDSVERLGGRIDALAAEFLALHRLLIQITVGGVAALVLSVFADRIF